MVIVNADDLNHDESINQAIRRLLGSGVVRSVSMIVNRKVLPSTVSILKEFSDVSFGLHFNLSRYCPLAQRRDVTSLIAPNGQFPAYVDGRAVLLRAPQFRQSDVEIELKAQYAAFLSIRGSAPSHIDSHHYVHSVPEVFAALQKFCLSIQLPLRRPVNPYGIRYAKRIDPRLLMTDEVLLALRGGKPTWRRWNTALNAVGGGVTEVVVHVRLPNTSRNDRDLARETELSVLVSESPERALEQYGIQFVNYEDIRRNSRLG